MERVQHLGFSTQRQLRRLDARTMDGLRRGEGVEGVGDGAHSLGLDVQVDHEAGLQSGAGRRASRLYLAAQRTPKYRARQRCPTLHHAHSICFGPVAGFYTGSLGTAPRNTALSCPAHVHSICGPTLNTALSSPINIHSICSGPIV